jgi:hypothetical protein
VGCNLSVRFTAVTTSTLLIPAGGNQIRICHYSIGVTAVANGGAQLEWGSGATCGTGTVAASPPIVNGSAVTTATPTITAGDGYGYIDENPVRGVDNLCVIIIGSGVASGVVRYGLF